MVDLPARRGRRLGTDLLPMPANARDRLAPPHPGMPGQDLRPSGAALPRGASSNLPFSIERLQSEA
jgi:hypothetical protein